MIVVIPGHTHLLFKKEISTDYDEMSDLSGHHCFLILHSNLCNAGYVLLTTQLFIFLPN